MNKLFETHPELNIKKIVITIILGLFLIVITIEIISGIFNKEKPDKTQIQSPNTVFYGTNNEISIELAKKYNLVQYNSSENYILELKSDTNLDIFISHRDLLENKSLYEVANADLRSYINEFSSYSNLSNLSEFPVGDKLAYTYSFLYPASPNNTAFFLQVVWLETDKGYYIFDIEFPLDLLNNYTNVINETLNTFKIL